MDTAMVKVEEPRPDFAVEILSSPVTSTDLDELFA
jgi:hypothetical protein